MDGQSVGAGWCRQSLWVGVAWSCSTAVGLEFTGCRSMSSLLPMRPRGSWGVVLTQEKAHSEERADSVPGCLSTVRGRLGCLAPSFHSSRSLPLSPARYDQLAIVALSSSLLVSSAFPSFLFVPLRLSAASPISHRCQTKKSPHPKTGAQSKVWSARRLRDPSREACNGGLLVYSRGPG